ncbi:MAG TPA: PfkB family carbohydrate kinase [Aliidongia sp.]|nr:PfkB family carbohydrate kinase [Aliidongia sp.]
MALAANLADDRAKNAGVGTQPASKVRTIAGLAEIAERLRSEGQTVVLAHGVFDLLHLGHLRHLKEAREQGDALIVTLTADSFVNKGPGRPVFAQAMRAEMLAALEIVDWVGINAAPTSQNVIEAIKPDVYVKGPDYSNPEADFTGGIQIEQQAVERFGGRLFLTDDVMFSSSSLINRYLGVHDEELGRYLETARELDMLPTIIDALDRVKQSRVLMIGDTIIDEYRYVSPLGKSQKENIITTLFRESEAFAGGIIASANHAAEFCGEVEIVTCLGHDDPYEELVRRSLKPNVKLHIVRRHGKPTTCKTRFVDPGYMRKLFEVYNMDDAPLDDHESAEVSELALSRMQDFDAVVVNDFGHGLIGPQLIEDIERSAPFLAVNVQTNSGNMGYNLVTRYRRADYICIDAPEARLAVGDKFSDLKIVTRDKLARMIDCPRMIVTHGAQGSLTYDRAEGMGRVPAFTKQVVDTVGAGDAFFAVTAPLAALGLPMEHLGFIGNAAGAIKVGIVGHRRSVERVPLIKFATALLK